MRIRARAVLTNPFEESIQVRLRVEPTQQEGWRWDGPPENALADAVVIETQLAPGQEQRIPLPFVVPASALTQPPAVAWEVGIQGQWLRKEPMRMAETPVVPLYPLSAWRNPPRWQVVGPFSLGAIDASRLPHDPEGANPNFFKRFGPEEGFRADAAYEGDLQWRPAASLDQGLINHNAILGARELAAAYNSCFIWSPEDQLTHALAYADNYAQVFLNGSMEASAQTFGAPGGFIYAPLTLKTGWNTLSVKVVNNRGDWFLRCLIADPRGNLKFSDLPMEVETGSSPK